MRLAALYIHEHFLFEQPQTINFGAKHHYEFNMSKENLLSVSMEANESFIEGFFGNGVTLISALVGANGAGKTNILKIINAGFQQHTKSVFIYENADMSLVVDNRMDEGTNSKKTKKKEVFTLEFPAGIIFKAFDSHHAAKLYYSPVFDQAVEDIGTPLKLNSHDVEKKIGDVFMDNIRKDAIFLHSDVSKTVKDIYPDFPSYDTLYIVPKILHKRDFRKVYIDSNIGNPQKAETLIYSIERDLRVKRFNDAEGLLNEYLDILKSSNITDALNDVWEMPQYQNKTENREHLLHDSSDFLKNIEINIISFLVINDTFPVTEFRGSYDFEKILKSTSFYEILDHFLAKYIVQFDRRFFDEYRDRINLDQADELISIVMGHYNMRARTYNDLETNNMISTNIHHNINGLKNIKMLYDIFRKLSEHIILDDGQSVLRIDVQREDIEKLLGTLFNVYSKVREYFSHLPMAIKDIIDIDTNVHLSYGEKSILNLYSSFYEFTQLKGELKEAKNFLLILDEADLGYHPIWKRKFIHALIMTMPELFAYTEAVSVETNAGPRKINIKQYSNLHIIIATHDPLTLSDFPNSNVVYLWKNENRFTEILDIRTHAMKSFGANITDLLAHSFFVKDGLIGDFAKQKIEQTIAWLNEEKSKKDNQGLHYIIDSEKYSYHGSIIRIIDEPVIRLKLAQMLDDLKDQDQVQREIIQREIDLLNEKLGRL